MALRRPSSSLLARVVSTSSVSSSSSSSFRSLSSSSSLEAKAAPAARPVLAKQKNSAIRGGGASSKRIERKPGSSYSFDRTTIPEINQTPISFDHVPRFTPNNVTTESIGKLHFLEQSTLKDVHLWGDVTGAHNGTMPFSVPRDMTIKFASKLNDVRSEVIETPESHKHPNWLIWGSSGSGKSHLILQTLAHAVQTGWITIYINDASRHTKNLYPYHYSPTTKTFHQPTLAAELCHKLSKDDSRNAALLSQIPLPEDSYTFTPDVAVGSARSRSVADVVFQRTIGAGRLTRGAEGVKETSSGWKRSLKELAELGASTPAISQAVLETVMKILTEQDRIPVLMAFDHVQAYFRESLYKTPELNVLESYHLAVPRLLLDFIAGRKQIARGALLSTITPLNAAFKLTPSFLHGLSLPTNAYPLGAHLTWNKNMYPQNPHETIQPWHSANARDMQIVEIPEGMRLEEAKGLWEINLERRRLHTVNSDDNFLAKYLEVAGNPRAFFRGIDYSLQ